jgi:spore coat protein H
MRNRSITFLASLGLMAVLVSGTACDPPWQGPPDYEAIFVSGRVVEWKISVGHQNWLRLIVDPASMPCQEGSLGPGCTTDSECPLTCRCVLESPDAGTCATHYVPADVEIDGVVYPDVGLRLMGNKTRQKRNMRIRFDEFVPGQRFHGVKRINLRNNAGDPSQIREALALLLSQRAGVPCPMSSFVWVSINGEPSGLYTQVEQVDRKFLERNFGEDYGDLYLVEPGGDLTYHGETTTDYMESLDRNPAEMLWFEKRYELKTNEQTPHPEDLINMMRVLEETPEADREDSFPEVLSLDAFLRVLALHAWFSNLDWYPGKINNTYLYHDATGRFWCFPAGMNRAFGNYHGDSCGFSTDQMLALDPDAPTCGVRPLVDKVLAVPLFRQRYHEHMQDLIDGVLHPEAVQAEMEVMRDLIDDHAHRDALVDFSPLEFETSFLSDIPEGDNPVRVPGLGSFVEERDRRIRDSLATGD